PGVLLLRPVDQAERPAADARARVVARRRAPLDAAVLPDQNRIGDPAGLVRVQRHAGVRAAAARLDGDARVAARAVALPVAADDQALLSVGAPDPVPLVIPDRATARVGVAAVPVRPHLRDDEDIARPDLERPHDPVL